jgi:TolA-binding protein
MQMILIPTEKELDTFKLIVEVLQARNEHGDKVTIVIEGDRVVVGDGTVGSRPTMISKEMEDWPISEETRETLLEKVVKHKDQELEFRANQMREKNKQLSALIEENNEQERRLKNQEQAIAHYQQKQSDLTELLVDAWSRMDRARSILNSRPGGNPDGWSVLDTRLDRHKLQEAIQADRDQPRAEDFQARQDG